MHTRQNALIIQNSKLVRLNIPLKQFMELWLMSCEVSHATTSATVHYTAGAATNKEALQQSASVLVSAQNHDNRVGRGMEHQRDHRSLSHDWKVFVVEKNGFHQVRLSHLASSCLRSFEDWQFHREEQSLRKELLPEMRAIYTRLRQFWRVKEWETYSPAQEEFSSNSSTVFVSLRSN